MWWLLPYYLHCFEHINQRHLGTAGRQAVVQYDSDVPCLRKLHRDVGALSNLAPATGPGRYEPPGTTITAALEAGSGAATDGK